MGLPTLQQILDIANEVDKVAGVLQRTDDRVQGLGQVVDMAIGPDDTDDEDPSDTREDEAP